jgi:hypothetical protein
MKVKVITASILAITVTSNCTFDATEFSSLPHMESFTRRDLMGLLIPTMNNNLEASGNLSKILTPTVTGNVGYNYRYSSKNDISSAIWRIHDSYFPNYSNMEEKCSNGDFFSITFEYVIN